MSTNESKWIDLTWNPTEGGSYSSESKFESAINYSIKNWNVIS
ncbi:MAG: hypothetical protein U9O87_06035 [Verrucomicrobiota bacterium]|nr:hypothetical protein [Verrucomicrobiota bacterium]